MYDRRMAAKRSVAKSVAKPARVKRAAPVVALPVRPVPSRELGEVGLRLWDDVHDLGEVRGCIEPLLMLCERFDERHDLRARLATPPTETESGDDAPSMAGERAALRALDAMIGDDFERLGLRTVLPNLSAVRAASWVTELAARR